MKTVNSTSKVFTKKALKDYANSPVIQKKIARANAILNQLENPFLETV